MHIFPFISNSKLVSRGLHTFLNNPSKKQLPSASNALISIDIIVDAKRNLYIAVTKEFYIKIPI